MIENSRYSIKPPKELFLVAAEAACLAVVVVLRDTVVEVFNAALRGSIRWQRPMPLRGARTQRGRRATMEVKGLTSK